MLYSTDKLRGKIKENRLTEKDVAKYLGISATTFSKKMNGTSVIELPHAIAMCKLLNTSLDELFLDNQKDIA